MNYVFYDTETTGLDKAFDQILQFGAILTDEQFNEIDRFEARCRLDPHVVPSAGALRVTGQSIAAITSLDRMSHYEMVCAIQDKMKAWCPALFVGWNTVSYDEPLLQQAFYKCLYRPYLTVTNGNERSDVMKLVQCLEAHGPGILEIPTNEKGKPSYKLDQVAPANGFPHLNAHDAMADVEATIFLAKLIKERAPDAWKHCCFVASKHRVTQELNDNLICLYRDNYFSKFCEFAVSKIGQNDIGGLVCFDLSNDPGAFEPLDKEAMKKAVSKSPKPLRTIRPNKAPHVMPASPGAPFNGVEYGVMVERATYLRENEALRQRLIEACEPEPKEAGTEVEQRIFDGFPSNADQSLMDQFHKADWAGRVEIAKKFNDERYRILGLRIVHHHAPDRLSEADRIEQAGLVAARLLGHAAEEPSWFTLHAALEEATGMLDGCEPAEAEMLEGFVEHIQVCIHNAEASYMIS